jgi:hypothetical protein
VGDEARSDVALTIAALVFGPLLVGNLRGGSGTTGVLLDLAVVLALTAVVPLLLIRSRGSSVIDALGLGTGPQAVAAGLPLAVPVAVAGTLAMVTAGAAPGAALLGRLSGAPLQVLQVAALSTGALVFVVFVVRRGTEAFPRSPEWPLRRLLRTIGMGAAALALVAGLLRVPLGADPLRVTVNALALAAAVLLADRLLGARQVAPRLAILLPAGVLLYLHVTSFGFSVGLQAGALAAGMVAVIGTLALSSRGTWVVVPLVVALHLWPTCLSPLALVRGLC